MSQQAAALQSYNSELVVRIQDLYCKRDELNRLIHHEQEEKEQLQRDIQTLTERLDRVSDSLEHRLAARETSERAMEETEAAYSKIIETCQSLLNVLKHEAGNLNRATQPLRTDH